MSNSTGGIVAKKGEVSIKIDAEVYRLLKTVAAWRGEGITEYLNSIVEPAVKKDVEKMKKELGQDEKE